MSNDEGSPNERSIKLQRLLLAFFPFGLRHSYSFASIRVLIDSYSVRDRRINLPSRISMVPTPEPLRYSAR